MNNMDINKLLAAISKMDKEELERNIYKAQTILENTNFKNISNKDDKQMNDDFSEVFNKFSEILKEKDIDLNNIGRRTR